DALSKYRDAKDAQKKGGAAPDQLTTALKGWHDALQACHDAESELAKASDTKLSVTTPTAQLRGAAAQLDKATHDRVQTHVTAPGNGWVSNGNIRAGSVWEACTPALALVEDGDWWVDANFKETDRGRIKPGQEAT